MVRSAGSRSEASPLVIFERDAGAGASAFGTWGSRQSPDAP